MLNPTSTFLTIQAQFKILHWQTQSYAKHKAYGEIYEAKQLEKDLIELAETILKTLKR
jgi:hypothetical protein